MASLEQSLKEAEKRENKLTAETNSNTESIKAEKKEIQQLKANANEDTNVLAEKEKELEKFGNLFTRLKEQDEKDSAAVVAAQERFQKISAGLLDSESGDNATLEQQVINAERIVIEAQTEIKQCEMGMKHIKEQLPGKQKELQRTEKDSRNETHSLEIKEKELKCLENELAKSNYTEGSLEALQNEKRTLSREVMNLQEQIDQFESRYPQLRFEYRNPDPGFRKESVKGLLCKLITLKDKSAAYALDVAAGGKVRYILLRWQWKKS